MRSIRKAAGLLSAILGFALTAPALAGGGDCDRLAASPHDPQRRAEGVPFAALDASAAIAACEAALEASPEEPRLAFQLGRALARAGQDAAALEAYRAAARLGHLAALHNIGQLHETGRLPGGGAAAANRWYLLAAERGFAPSQLRLGLAYLAGAGIVADKAKGAAWIALAAGQGFGPAQLVLGMAYEGGEGVPRDLEAARLWYARAAGQGIPEARQRLAALEDAR